jgi:serine/threonine protein kinase
MMKYGRYNIIERLGMGSMGEVYLAHDPHIDRRVALKALHKQHIESKEIVHRFIKEAKAIGRLSHPGIVKVYDVGQDHGTIFLVMEYLEGQPLNKLVQAQKLDLTLIVDIGKQVAAALDYAHQNGIVHRDIKPSNLILTKGNRVKLADFGIAHVKDISLAHKTALGDILGTPTYMSPEQIAGKGVDGRSDLYSLGVVLYELLTGRRPFKGKNFRAIYDAITDHNPAPPVQVNPDLPLDLSKLILKAMAKHPSRRFQSGTQLEAALDTYLLDDRTRLVRDPHPKGKRFKYLGWVAILLVALVLSWQTYRKMTVDQAATALVTFTSEPSDAGIYLNNTFKGKTPLSFQLPLGSYDVRLTLAEHYESEAQINVQEVSEMPVHLRLIPKEGF